MAYLTYDEYINLGGTVKESAFTLLESASEKKLNYITGGRTTTLTTVPDEVKELLVQYIELANTYNNTTKKQLSSYSNGVESFNYISVDGATLDKQYYQLAKEYLAGLDLLYRGGARFEYL